MFNGFINGTATLATVAFPHYYQVQFPTSTTVSKYTMWADPIGSDPGLGDTPNSWTFLGSNDGATLTTVDTRVNSPPPSTFGETGNVTTAMLYSEYTLPALASYTYFRISISDTVSTSTTRTRCRTGEMECWGPAVSVLGEPVPTPVPEPPK